jgi:holo-[acyl-carrier protein] synthase
MQIGVDIIEIPRIGHLLKKYPNFRYRVFTDGEIAYCENKRHPVQHYAARFAAKESIMKAFGSSGPKHLHWKDLEILVSSSGEPLVQLHGEIKVAGDELGIKEVAVSLSHCKEYAVAVAQIISG